MANYEDARREWAQALTEADGDEHVARGLLLARILHELEDMRSRLSAMTETMERRW